MTSRNPQAGKSHVSPKVKSLRDHAENARRRRSILCETIRKNKRNESLHKRRQLVHSRIMAKSSSATTSSSSAATAATLGTDTGGSGSSDNDNAATDETSLVDLTNTTQVQQLMAAFNNSTDPNLATQATVHFRRLLSIENAPPIDAVLQLDVLPRMMRFVKCAEQPTLQLEAAWCITNIASGEPQHTRAVIEASAVPTFIKILATPTSSEALRDQCVWGLGNMAGDGPEARDYCLGQEILAPLLAQFSDSSSVGLMRNATWCLSNLCRGRPQPSITTTLIMVPVLAKLLCYPDVDVQADAAWACSFLTDSDNAHIQCVVDAGVVPRLVELLTATPTLAIQTPVLKTVGNIVTGTTEQTATVLAANPLPTLRRILTETGERALRRETAWLVSNVTAGTPSQIQQVVDAQFMPILAHMIRHAPHEERVEACWAVANACINGQPRQLRAFITPDIVFGFTEALKSARNEHVSLIILQAMNKILEAGQSRHRNLFLPMFQTSDTREVLEDLQVGENDEISEHADIILGTYLGDDEDDFDTDDDNDDAAVLSSSSSSTLQTTPTFGLTPAQAAVASFDF